MGIALTLFPLDSQCPVPLDTAWNSLACAERRKADAFVFRGDRDRYIRGRGVLRDLLGRASDQPASKVKIEEGPFGKPELVDKPDFHFNLSHTEDWALFASSEEGPVGVDIEATDRAVDPLHIGPAVLQPHEMAVIESRLGSARNDHFFAYWTAKEAVMKLTGQGMSLEPKTIALELGERAEPVSATIASDPKPIQLRQPPVDLYGLTAAIASFESTDFTLRTEIL